MKGSGKFLSECVKRSIKDLPFEEVDFDKEEWFFLFSKGEWFIGNKSKFVLYVMPDCIAKIIRKLYWEGVHKMRMCMSSALFGEASISPEDIKECIYLT